MAVKHVYLSTGCLHGEHEYCKSMVGMQGAKRPAQCKFCNAECVCDCHDPWNEPCKCGHPMRRHALDWDLDPEVDCNADGCRCPEFQPSGVSTEGGISGSAQ